MEPFWVNTSENSLIRSAMKEIEEPVPAGYETLIESGTYRTEVKMDSSYYEVRDVETLWGMLLSAGDADRGGGIRGWNMYAAGAEQGSDARIPGADRSLHRGSGGSMAQMFRRLMEKDLEAFAGEYKRLLRTLPSYYDLKEENSYHMMIARDVHLPDRGV